MNAKRLTLIRRARTAIERAMQINQFNNPAKLWELKRAYKLLGTAKERTLNGSTSAAEFAMQFACNHLSAALGEPS